MEENEKQDNIDNINSKDSDNLGLNSEDIFIKESNENNSVKNEETNTTELNEEDQIEAVNLKKICPQCGNEYTKEDLFCNKCGIKLDKRCPYCGAEYEVGDIFCGVCGNNLSNINKKSNSIPTQYKKIERAYTTSQNTDTCRFCKSKIPKGVSKCPNCGEWLKGGSHFGCGSFLMILILFIGIISAFGAFSFQVPWLGEVTGAVAFICIFAVWLYLLPSLIAESRGHESKFGIFLVNLFFGLTGIGWIVALVLAFSGERR